MAIGDKSTALFIDTSQKSGFFAVTAVNADVAELNATLPCHFKHRQRQLRFTLKLPFILRYRGFLAALVIVTPSLRQIEPRIDQRGHVAPAQGREVAHLTVIDFPQTAIPLPGNAGRCLAFPFDKLRTGLAKPLSSKINTASVPPNTKLSA